ncbi:MAG: acetolactate synthase [Actinobacteria bacterium ATB1]|nr:acetolactate synthase [Actinobacteria bacterium ATB1]
MTETTTVEGSGGLLVVEALKRFGVDTIFTLSGGHVFPIYDGCRQAGISIVDTRHEQTATFAAEGVAKLTRRPGVAVLTAGPGVTNGVSAVTTAQANGSPLVVLGGRAPQARWGAGSLQEFDHVPLLAAVTKRSATAFQTARFVEEIDATVLAATTAHRGPAFLDLPMDLQFVHERVDLPDAPLPPPREHDPDTIAAVLRLVADAERPALVVGTDAYWDGAWEQIRAFAEAAQIPVFMNGMGRGVLSADHELAFARARSTGLREADLVLVAGTPLDFRLGFGRFGDAKVVHIADSAEQTALHVELAASLAGDLILVFESLAEGIGAEDPRDHSAWLEKLRGEEMARREAEKSDLYGDSQPIRPSRVYGALLEVMDRDAVVICDGGDFVSYAGKYIDSYEPGLWMDPGPFGCLGTGLGYAIAARTVHPSKQVFMLMGDGAFGFSAMDFDTLVRFGLPVVAICGNNGIWGLEKHPMQALYGYDVAADLQPGCRYDQIVEALGGHGELVTEVAEIVPALHRALDSGAPSLVNVLTDPADMYPRSSSLA